VRTNAPVDLQEIKRRAGRLSQVGGTRHYELSDGRSRGVRAIDVDTGGGLQFTVLPDRGLDISRCSFRGNNLVFHGPAGEVHPAYYDPAGYEWLRVFFAGLLTTCGLTHFGHPVRDGAEDLGLHGRYSGTPATQVADLSGEDGEGNYPIIIRGVVEEASLFGDKLRLVRTIRTRLGARSFTISDEIHNFGQRPAPITLAYHFNIGHPLLHEDAELRLPEAPVRCYDEASERDAADRLRIAPPSADAAHNVYHHMLQGDGPAAAAVVNPSLGVGGIGLYIRFDRRQLPVLNTWKHMGVGDYVLGIEPGTARIVDRPQLRAAGELPEIAPGETRRFDLEVGVLEGRAECDAFRA